MGKATGKAYSMSGGLVIGTLMSLGVTLLGAAVLAKLIDGEILLENSIGYGIMVILVAASYLGAMMSYSKIKRQQLVVCMAAGLIYFLVLLSITALFFGGQYSAVGVTALLILCGCGLAVLSGTHKNRGGKRLKMKIPNR